MQRPRDQGQRVQGTSEVGIQLGILILHSLSLDRGSPGQSELLAEEGVQLRLGELHHQELEAGVEEAGVSGLVAGHLGLPLAQPGHGVKQVSRWTSVYSVRTEHPWSHLLAHEELGAGAGLSEVARLRARVERA